MDIYELAEKGLRATITHGADEAEVFIIESKNTSINIIQNEVAAGKENTSQGIGIRAIVNGAVGFSSTNILSHVESTAKNAVSAARIRERDPDWLSLPNSEEYPHVHGLVDPELEQMDLSNCIDLSLKMVEGAKTIPNTMVTSGKLGKSITHRLIINTNGIEIEDQGTRLSGYVSVITENGLPSTADEFRISRSHDINFEELGKNAADLARRSQNGIEIESQTTDVILHPFAISDLLENTFMASINSDNVQKSRSSLSGKIEHIISTEKLSIIDDGLLKSGISSSKTDSEGYPSQRTTIIDKGSLKSFLYNTYTAGKEGIKSTGNAGRNSYMSTPSVNSRNLIIQHPGTDIINETEKGIFVPSLIGAHTANAISGDFSVEARNAFVVKDGQIDRPIKSLMISGNIFDLLMKINGAGKDIRDIGGTITPSLRIEDMSITG